MSALGLAAATLLPSWPDLLEMSPLDDTLALTDVPPVSVLSFVSVGWTQDRGTVPFCSGLKQLCASPEAKQRGS